MPGSDDSPAFYEAEGWLTVYGLGCGYIEQYKHPEKEIQVTLYVEGGVVHVRSYNFKQHCRVFWDVYELEDLDKARLRFGGTVASLQHD